MNSRPELKLDWCSHEAAKHAVMNWHYSKRMPSGKLICVGVWETQKFIGVVIFGHGATLQIGMPYKLEQMQVCELVRVALTKHQAPVSRILAIALKMLTKHSSGIRLVVSYADEGEGHHGGIYQAGNWFYVGKTQDSSLKINGVVHHRRSISAKYGTQKIEWLRKYVDKNAELVADGAKYKYLFPIGTEMKAQLEPLRRPYPKRV